MTRIFLVVFATTFLSLDWAYACSCIGETTKVSEFLEEVTIVWGIPQKSEWISRNPPRLLEAPERKNFNFKNTRTTLVDVRTLQGNRRTGLSFYSDNGGSSCSVTVQHGRGKWFILDKAKNGRLEYNLCTMEHVPAGAIIDYYTNGNDALVPSRWMCRSRKYYDFENNVKSDELGFDRITEETCKFWDPDNQFRLRKIQWEYTAKIRKMFD